MIGIKRVTSITFEVDPSLVWGHQVGQRPAQYLAERMTALMDPERPGYVAAFQFEGPRWMPRKGVWSTRWFRFWSEDIQLNEAKLAGRRIAGSAQHKTAGDPAGRRAS